MKPHDCSKIAGAAVSKRPLAAFAGRRLIAAAALVAVFAASVDAQVVPGDSPNTGIGAAAASRPTGIGGISSSRVPAGPRDDYQGEQQYRKVLQAIPDRKVSNDPWRTIRSAPAADRHRAQ
ncbi:MAG: hypothetical protein WCG92_04365 [Hyphomicrobiales bacterium]|nr:hypothetical protein [Alphaproteobacteria bacterium]